MFFLWQGWMTDLGLSLHQALRILSMWRGMSDLYALRNQRSLFCVRTGSTGALELTYLPWRALILSALYPEPLSMYLCPMTFWSIFSSPSFCTALDMLLSLWIVLASPLFRHVGVKGINCFARMLPCSVQQELPGSCLQVWYSSYVSHPAWLPTQKILSLGK